ncbi:MAG: thioredoxin family protein [Desulfovibrionaceae bacterium]
MIIKVLGPGCAKCAQAEKIMHEALAEAGIAETDDVRVEKVTDFQEIAAHGIFSTPAVVIDGETKCIGQVPTKAEALSWLKS